MDPIADMLTRIRNAALVKKTEVIVPLSRIKLEIAQIMEDEKFVKGLQILEKEKQFKIFLKYNAEGASVIRNLKRISKSGKRVYVPKDKLPKVLGGIGVAVISTSQGLMTAEEARKRGLGGEVICEIY